MSKHQQCGLVINKTSQKRTFESEENLEPKNKKYKKSELAKDISHQNIEISNELNDINEINHSLNEPVIFFYDTNLINFNINHSNWLNQIQLKKENSNDVSIDNSNATISNESSNSYLNDETQSYSNSNGYQFSSAPMFTFSINPNFNINLEQGFISLINQTDQKI